jgi:hypothetical protein
VLWGVAWRHPGWWKFIDVTEEPAVFISKAESFTLVTLGGFSKTLTKLYIFFPKDEDSKFLQNVGQFLQYFTLKMASYFPSKTLVNIYRIASLHILTKSVQGLEEIK